MLESQQNADLFKYAKYENSKELIEKAVQAGADLNAINENGATPLHVATQNGNNIIVSALIELKANLNDKDQNGSTPLHYAVMLKNKEAAKALVEVGANPNIKNNDNKTALKIAQERDYLEMVKILLPTIVHKTKFYSQKRSYSKITKNKAS